MKIKALRMFSHYHLGTVSQGETRVVKKEIGEALVKLHLAEEVETEKVGASDPVQSEKAKTGGKGGNKRGADGADKDASQG
ncbi:hypothetical protein [Citrobacter braakii]|uniref:hypothetical protein n=1 Tax=Citrobacter braakii TaxID=57706 RepID=UPI0023B3060E|nr:hypothetical protein [Citrobacter braakii]MDE9584610.1 hypothetical protein [Citrobacter braakii]